VAALSNPPTQHAHALRTVLSIFHVFCLCLCLCVLCFVLYVVAPCSVHLVFILRLVRWCTFMPWCCRACVLTRLHLACVCVQTAQLRENIAAAAGDVSADMTLDQLDERLTNLDTSRESLLREKERLQQRIATEKVRGGASEAAAVIVGSRTNGCGATLIVGRAVVFCPRVRTHVHAAGT